MAVESQPNDIALPYFQDQTDEYEAIKNIITTSIFLMVAPSSNILIITLHVEFANIIMNMKLQKRLET